MALTVTVTSVESTNGRQMRVYGTIKFDSSYLTGGELITAAMLGLSVLDELYVFPPVATTPAVLTFIPAANIGAGTIQMFTAPVSTALNAGLGEVTSTTDLSAYTCPFMAYGV